MGVEVNVGIIDVLDKAYSNKFHWDSCVLRSSTRLGAHRCPPVPFPPGGAGGYASLRGPTGRGRVGPSVVITCRVVQGFTSYSGEMLAVDP